MRAQLGKYQLVAEVARGGMGIVYLAVAQGPARFSKLLVVKELKPELVEGETFSRCSSKKRASPAGSAIRTSCRRTRSARRTGATTS